MLESLSYFEIISCYPNCEPLSKETLGEAFREKDFTLDVAVFWLGKIPFTGIDLTFNRIHEYCADIADKICDIFSVDKKYKNIILYGIFPKNYNPPTDNEWNILFEELEDIEGIEIEGKTSLWYIQQLVCYYLISLYSNNVFYYYKIKPLLKILKDGRHDYEEWITEMAKLF